MSAPNSTLGPWHVEQELGHPVVLRAIGDGCSDAVALVNHHDEFAAEEGEAIARLIAATPDMLAALHLALPELRDDLESFVESCTIRTRAWSAEQPLPADFDDELSRASAEQKKAAFDAVSAAIARAEGRA